MPRFSLRMPRISRRRPSDSEISRELRDHLELDAEERAARGADARDARLGALRHFGSVASIQEETREAWGSLWLERLGQDLRFGLRMLRRAPVFSIIGVSCLALGIGANAAVSSWTEGIVHHPFAGVSNQDQLVAVVATAKGTAGFEGTSFPDFMELARGTSGFSAFFVSKIAGAALTVPLAASDRAERVVGQLVTANYFDAVGVRPVLGRGFLPGEDIGRGAHPVAVLGYRLWQDRFHGSRAIVGSTLNFNGVPHTIIGVAPEDFLGTFVGYAMQFWAPVSQQAVFDAGGYKLEDRSARWVEGFARLKPGVTIAAGQAQVDAVAQRLALEFPNDDRGRGVRILSLSDNPFDHAKELKPMLRVSRVVAILVLFIVCANIANLLLARALARRGELTVRRALGAGRARLTRQLTTEGLLLALLGTAFGILLAYLARNLPGLFFPARGGIRLVFTSDFNWRVLAGTAGIGLGSTLIFALAPAINTTGMDLASAIRAAAPGAISSGGRGWLRSSLILVQVALSVLLLVGAGLMARSVSSLLAADPGYDASRVTAAPVSLFGAGYDTARAHRFDDDLLNRAKAIAGVSSVALAQSLPFANRPYDNGPILVDGYSPARDEHPAADYNQVTPGYFQTLGIPFTAGRDFSAADADTSAPVAIVSRAMAERYWPGVSPIGRRLQLRNTWMRVVGVVANVKYESLTESPRMLFYVPLAQQRSTMVSLLLRSARSKPPAGLAAAIAGDIHAVDPNVSPSEILTLREQVNRSTSGQQIMVALLIVFGAVALCLAAMGLYGTIAYMVSQSTRELGVRIAFGATPSRLVMFVMSAGVRLTLIGIVLGLGLALGTTRLLGDLLFGVGPRDPLVIASVVAVMTSVSVVACLVPAWRASQLDPVRALRA